MLTNEWSVRSCGIHLRSISQEMLMNLIHTIHSDTMLFRLLPHHPTANELTHGGWDKMAAIFFRGIWIPIIKISWLWDHLIFNDSPYTGKTVLSYWNLFQNKGCLSRYGDSLYKEKMVVRPSYLYIWIWIYNECPRGRVWCSLGGYVLGHYGDALSRVRKASVLSAHTVDSASDFHSENPYTGKIAFLYWNLFQYEDYLSQHWGCQYKDKSVMTQPYVIQSGTKPNLVAKILATKIGNLWA